MAHYVIGDIHGCFDEFMTLVKKIDAIDKEAQYILIGDIVDRGDKQWEMLKFAIENVNKPGSRFRMIIGNHEFDKLKYLNSSLTEAQLQDPKKIMEYGWIDQYYFPKVLLEHNASASDIRDIIDFFEQLPFYMEIDTTLAGKDQHYILVHGGLPRECVNRDGSGTFRESELSEKQSRMYDMMGRRNMKIHLVWDRYSDLGYIGNSIVIHGHTPTITDSMIWYGAIPGRIFYQPHEINVDCGCVFRDSFPESNLAAICLESLEEFYVYDIKDEIIDENTDGGYKYKEEMIRN